MPSKYNSIDLSNLKTISIKERQSKVNSKDFACIHTKGSSLTDFIDTLPNILAGSVLRKLIGKIIEAKSKGKPVIVSMGAHVIKCGLSPIIIDLMRRGVIDALALNGAGAIHDCEVALVGATSEDVVKGMQDGSFGMAYETADFLNSCAKISMQQDLGFGESLGKALLEQKAEYNNMSLLACAYELDVPVTIHACIGCDIVHMHESAEGDAIGAASMHDFRILTSAMKELGNGGVIMNLGSAVVMPEVILKALTTVINLGYNMSGMFGFNLDFVQHYRSNTQIVARVKEIGGDGASLTGHHEIMIPLIAAGIIES